jgi:hypothetical protein
MGNDKELKEIIYIETVLERNQLVQRFILEHDKDLPTAEMVTLLAKQIYKAILSAGYVRRDRIGIDKNALDAVLTRANAIMGLQENKYQEVFQALAQSDIIKIEEG